MNSTTRTSGSSEIPEVLFVPTTLAMALARRYALSAFFR